MVTGLMTLSLVVTLLFMRSCFCSKRMVNFCKEIYWEKKPLRMSIIRMRDYCFLMQTAMAAWIYISPAEDIETKRIAQTTRTGYIINDGKGNFTLAANALPNNYTSKLCVRAFDYNKDGKPDLFVSGRVDPWNYPKPVSSFIFRNDSDKGHIKFTDVTEEVAPDLKNIGMVCDALFTDFDNDNQTDLILAGEWMPVTFLKNIGGKFKNVTSISGIDNKTGWWNSIVAGDFRHTGRTDYIVGNVGLNTLYQASDQYPVYITAKDFDNNGGYEAFTSLFLKDQKGQIKEFPANGRDDVIEKLPAMKKRFNNYQIICYLYDGRNISARKKGRSNSLKGQYASIMLHPK